MSEQEIEALEKRELSVKDEISAGWKHFWEKRGVTLKLISPRVKTPMWYNERFGYAENYSAYASDLDPEDLMTRALTRKRILKW